jgi:hypothetical protein
VNAPAARQSCSICLAPPATRESIEARLARGQSARSVSRYLRSDGPGVTYDYRTISAHWRRCLGHSFKLHGRAARRRTEILDAVASPGSHVAVRIRDAAVKALNAGELHVTATHGLRAQELLDRRAERGGDRSLAIRLAVLLAGGPPPPEVVDGGHEDLDDPERLTPLR